MVRACRQWRAWSLAVVAAVAVSVVAAPQSGSAAPDRTLSTHRSEPDAQALTAGPRRVLTNGCRYSRRGIPACGAYVGATHGSNTDPRNLEAAVGRLGVRRTFYDADDVDSAVRTARHDLERRRLPWISFKLPYSWESMATGRGDAWARRLSRKLSRLDGPVWVAFHHEPEGDGNVQAWRRMQERLVPIVRRTARNVAFTVIVTGWHQFYGDPEYSLRNIWPRNVNIDVAGFDIYQQYGVVKDGETTTSWTSFAEYYRKIARWSRRADVAWGLAETGVTDVAADARPGHIRESVNLLKRHGGVAYSLLRHDAQQHRPVGPLAGRQAGRLRTSHEVLDGDRALRVATGRDGSRTAQVAASCSNASSIWRPRAAMCRPPSASESETYLVVIATR